MQLTQSYYDRDAKRLYRVEDATGFLTEIPVPYLDECLPHETPKLIPASFLMRLNQLVLAAIKQAGNGWKLVKAGTDMVLGLFVWILKNEYSGQELEPITSTHLTTVYSQSNGRGGFVESAGVTKELLTKMGVVLA